MAKKSTSPKAPGSWSGNLSKFGKYLKKHGLTRDAVAVGADVTPSYVSMLAHGKASPGFKLAARISEWTKKNAPEAFELAAW